MTREEHLHYCKVCEIQKFDPNQGIICGITNLVADFEGACNSFKENKALKTKYESVKISNEILVKSASQGKRLANFFIDMIFLLLFSFMIGAILALVLMIISPSSLSIFDSQLTNYLLGIVAGLLYFTIFEATTGRTMAKFITRTKVVDKNGKKPGFGTILLRSFCRYIPFDAFSYLGSDPGWHDTLSKTIVIDG